MQPRNEVISTFSREEVEAMVDESHVEGLLDQGEYERLAGALDFTSRTVTDVLLPLRGSRRSTRRPRGRRRGRLRRHRLLAVPVVGDDGELVGYLHIKDVLQSDPHGRARMVEDKWVRPFARVRADDTLVTALQMLQAKGAHMARVVDDDGAVLGVATLEDVIEELVGEIRDAAHADGHCIRRPRSQERLQAAGRVSTIRVPSPSSGGRASIRPPCRSTMFLHTERPIP